ncbi:hypothetical protein KM043_014548 [Ampulex compressa]|nr:hypothetical protein KM043_014548 [Ampulex compressa]
MGRSKGNGRRKRRAAGRNFCPEGQRRRKRTCKRTTANERGIEKRICRFREKKGGKEPRGASKGRRIVRKRRSGKGEGGKEGAYGAGVPGRKERDGEEDGGGESEKNERQENGGGPERERKGLSATAL